MTTQTAVKTTTGDVSIQLPAKTKAALVITWGDEDSNGTPDFHVKTYGKLPFTNGEFKKLLDLGPYNVPLDQMQTMTLTALAALPLPPQVKLPIQGLAAGLFGALRIVL
jgi:hypothetical protein